MEENFLPMHENCLLKMMDSDDPGCLGRLPSLPIPFLEGPQPLERPVAVRGGRLFPVEAPVIARPRKSGFIRPFDGTATGTA